MRTPTHTLVLASLLTLAAFAPAASAQTDLVATTVEVAADPGTGPLVPGTETRQVPLLITYTWENGGAAPPGSSIEITLTAVAPASATITIDPPTVTVPAPALQAGSATAEATATVTLNGEAPGLTDLEITIIAQAAEAGNLKEAMGETTFTLQAAAVMLGTATAIPPIIVLDLDEPVGLGLSLQNLGNVAVVPSFQFNGVPAGIEVIVPASFTPIGARPLGTSDRAEFPIQFNVTGPVDAGSHDLSVTVTFTAVAANESTWTGTANLTVVVPPGPTPEPEVTNFVPAPPAALGLLAVAGVALVIAARRRQ
ncbi:MAG TPA: hypothetical protein VNZ52_06175 [Candidatus Thermoplasmatota archaeon]|nr:hypothetical protein [Candidatus Thermoplasmatota archaeon]